MSSSEALNGPPSPTLADQQAADVQGQQDGGSSSISTSTAQLPVEGAAKPSRVFKMSDEFLMFKFKVSCKTPWATMTRTIA